MHQLSQRHHDYRITVMSDHHLMVICKHHISKTATADNYQAPLLR